MYGRQPGAWASLTDKLCLLHEDSQSRLGEVALLSTAQKPTQTVKENKITRRKKKTTPKVNSRKKIKIKVKINEIGT